MKGKTMNLIKCQENFINSRTLINEYVKYYKYECHGVGNKSLEIQILANENESELNASDFNDNIKSAILKKCKEVCCSNLCHN
jgi:hypothetical protein